MSSTEVQEVVHHRGYTMVKGIHDPEEIDQIQDLEIRDSDVFVVTFPKSGTVWLQQILLLLQTKGDMNPIMEKPGFTLARLVPWIESKGQVQLFGEAESPRYRVTHLPYHLMPKELNFKKGKVIYVVRNPKDVLVSLYYFQKLMRILETPKSFDEFFDKFVKGGVTAGNWFEHIKSWFPHKDDVSMLFISYEEMIKDLKTVVKRIAEFLGSDLTQDQLDDVVQQSTFKNMKHNPKVNYEKNLGNLFNNKEGHFMRKGTIGDWKNHFTVAQNEQFDEILKQELKNIPISFIWDMKDI